MSKNESAVPHRDVIVRQRSEHPISRRHIDPDALKVLYRLRQHGYIAYLVGGGVRDLLLGRSPKDFDISTDAHPNQIKGVFRNCFLIGRRFRLAHIRFGQNIIETSTFRREPDAVPDKEVKGAVRYDENTFGTPEEDAWRRDFTINGMFYDISTFSIIDYVGGLEDLESRTIRTIGNPARRFEEDPVRMLRAVRFASRLGFDIEPATYKAILRHHAKIQEASPPRLIEEVSRLFGFQSGRNAFELLEKTGLLADIFPELAEFMKQGDGSGRETVLRYLGALDACGSQDGPPPPMTLIFACMVYPIFLAELEGARQAGESPQHTVLARSVIEPLAIRFRMSKRVSFEAVHVIESQRRFESMSKRQSRERFMSRGSFPFALVLREVHLRANGEDLSSLREWQVTTPREGKEGRTRAPVAGRPKRRRGGRPRRRVGRSNDGTTSAAAQKSSGIARQA